jgi:hypothetical protein
MLEKFEIIFWENDYCQLENELTPSYIAQDNGLHYASAHS